MAKTLKKIYLTVKIILLLILHYLLIYPIRWFYRHTIRGLIRWLVFQYKKYEALSYHWEDGKQYHVLEDEGKYKIVSRNSIKLHNEIAKGRNDFKHLTMKEVNEMALYSTPLKGRTER